MSDRPVAQRVVCTEEKEKKLLQLIVETPISRYREREKKTGNYFQDVCSDAMMMSWWCRFPETRDANRK